MKICYNCFHEVKASMLYCENCGFRLEDQDTSAYPDALTCGTTLYGRYLTGRVLEQDNLMITYLAQDSRTGETVAVREFFPKQVCERSSSTTVSVPEQLRGVFQQGKDLFLQEMETLSDLRENAGEKTGIQSFFNQNNTAYMVVEYTDAGSLLDYLARTDGRGFRREVSRLLYPEKEQGGGLRSGAPGSGVIAAGFIPANAVREIVSEDPEEEKTGGKHDGSAPGHPQRENSPENPAARSFADGNREEPAGPAYGRPSAAADAGIESPAQKQQAGAVRSGESAIDDPPAAMILTGPDPAGRDLTETGRPAADSPAPATSTRKKAAKNSILPFAALAAFIVCAALIVLLVFRLSSGLGNTLDRRPFDRFFIQRILRRFTRIPGNKVDNKSGNNKSGNDTKKERDDAKKSIKDIEKDLKNLFPQFVDVLDNEGGEEGISAGNFYNCGTFAVYGDDTFFIDSNGLNRWKDSDPDDSELITHSASRYLNVWQDHLYFMNERENLICRCEPDGSNETVVLDPSPDPKIIFSSLYIRGDWCYFSSGNDLYRIDMEELEGEGSGDVTQAVLITSDFNGQNFIYESMCFLNGRIFYNGLRGINGIYPNGSGKISISKHTGNLFTDGTSVFCDFGVRHIYRIGEDGSEENILDLDESEMIINTNYCDGWVYYISKNEGEFELWRIRADGSDGGYVETIGSAEDSLISFCVFPGNEYACIYWLKTREDGALVSAGEKYPLEP